MALMSSASVADPSPNIDQQPPADQACTRPGQGATIGDHRGSLTPLSPHARDQEWEARGYASQVAERRGICGTHDETDTASHRLWATPGQARNPLGE